jgi:hypothetical protein
VGNGAKTSFLAISNGTAGKLPSGTRCRFAGLPFLALPGRSTAASMIRLPFVPFFDGICLKERSACHRQRDPHFVLLGGQ